MVSELSAATKKNGGEVVMVSEESLDEKLSALKAGSLVVVVLPEVGGEADREAAFKACDKVIGLTLKKLAALNPVSLMSFK